MARWSEPRELRSRPWLTVALLCGALLFLPALAWIVAPHIGGFASPPAPKPAAAFAPVDREADQDSSAEERDRTASTGEAQAAGDAARSDGGHDEGEGIVGTVLDPEGKPVERATVTCIDRPGQPEVEARSAAGGRFSLPLAAEGCKVVARHPEFAASNEERLANGRPNELRLKAGGKIEGVVIDEHGVGVNPVTVDIESFVASGGAPSTPRSSSTKSFDVRSGAFNLEKLAPGRYVLSASAAGRPPAHSDPIDVESGRTARGVKIVLLKSGKVEGKVLDAETKRPVAGATVSLDSVSSGEAKDATTDNQGRFMLDGAPSGPFSIRVSHDDYTAKIVPSLTAPPGGAPAHLDVELARRGDGGARTELSGIGAGVSKVEGVLTVAFLQPDSPAVRAGLETRDQILRIDGVDVERFTTTDCIQRLRGPAGTSVVVSVKRPEGVVDLTITRGELKF